jgi:Zn-finger nucleic acid-binding protein
MLCPKCNEEHHPVQALNAKMKIVDQCPRCEHEFGPPAVWGETATQTQIVQPSPPRATAPQAAPASPGKPRDAASVLSLAKDRYAQLLAEESKFAAIKAERKQLERMIHAAERGQTKGSN